MTYQDLEQEEVELQRQVMAAHIRACTGTVFAQGKACGELEELKVKLARIPERRRELFRVIECGAPSRPMEPGPFGPKAA